ncbi:MAG: penicillin acylase family protein [Anaerolineae bacterium]
MKWLRRIIVVIGILVLLVVLLIPLGGYLLLRRSFPMVEGTIQVPGLKAPVEVYRDKWGVPHIYAQNVEDLFFAQGYVTAQDRLWQMEFNRRVGSGTLSEVLGEATLETDQFIRTIGWKRVAEEEAANLDEETRTILEAYAAGVNAFIDEANLPPEFLILGFKPDPWTPADTIAWGKVMAWDLGGNWEAELLRASLIEKFGEEKASQLAPPYPADAPLVIPSEALGYQVPGTDRLRRQAHQLRVLLAAPGAGLGSNNWVIDGQKSATGMPLLANDMHLGIQMPSIWYEVHLVGGGFNVEGYSFPGVPGIIVGHNEDIAWAVTNVGPDVQDLYIEKVNPANPDQYEYQGQWLEMEIVEEVIEVKGEEPVVERVRLTRHGPIITPVIEGVTETLAFRWTALEPNQIFKSVLMLNRAKNWEAFQEALRFWAVPSQNFVYADREGNIGYQMPGWIPIRAQGQGLVPVSGWTGEYEWEGYIPFDELPHILNPSNNYIVTANNRVIGDEYPYFISHDWAVYRARRLTQLLGSQDTLSIEEFKRIHADTYSIPAEIFMPYLLAIKPEGWLQERAMNQLEGWDLHNEAQSTGAGIFQVFYLMLVKNTFADELGDLFADYLDADTWHHLALERMLREPNNPWFDDVTTPERENRDDIVRRSFAEACDLLGKRFGDVPHEWTWGRLHTVTFDHPLGAVKPLNLIFNRGPIPARGSGFTVNAASFDYSAFAEGLKPMEIGEVFAVQSGVSQRLIVDLSDFSNSLSIHTTGQVGIPFHKHYGDMISSWQGVKYHPLLWEKDEIERNKEGLLILEPKSE